MRVDNVIAEWVIQGVGAVDTVVVDVEVELTGTVVTCTDGTRVVDGTIVMEEVFPVLVDVEDKVE